MNLFSIILGTMEAVLPKQYYLFFQGAVFPTELVGLLTVAPRKSTNTPGKIS